MKRVKADRARVTPGNHPGESGQASIYLILMLGTFLIASMAFSVDLTNMWFHRQQAQTAADAACQAGALDMLSLANGVTPPAMHFTATKGSPQGVCDSSLAATMCQYALFNGYDGTGGFNSNAVSRSVSWTFPSSVAGATAPSTGSTAPYLNVVIKENVKTWFMSLIGVQYVPVSASCTCGMSGAVAGGAPIVVLNPTIQGALNLSGGAVIKISGGPQTTIQINSSNTDNMYGSCGSTNQSSQCFSAISCSGSGQIDTSTAGPKGTGGDVSVTGGPAYSPYCGSNPVQVPGTTGHWHGGIAAVADPYAWVLPPDQKAAYSSNPATRPLWVPYKTDGCPANANMGQYLTLDTTDPRTAPSMAAAGQPASCLELFPGYYPNGIDLTGGEFNARGVGASYSIAIFAPGTYYLNGNLVVTNGATVRNAWPGVGSPSGSTPNQTSGVTFYFYKGGPAFGGNTDANDGKIDPVPQSFLACTTSSTPPPGSINGALLMAPCTTNGGYFQSGGAHTDTISSTGNRGLLMYGSPDNVIPANNPTTFGASGSLTFVGSLYFSAKNKTFADVLTMNGAAGPNTIIVGQIIADQIQLSGSGKITMDVAPGSSASTTMQVGVFQ